MTENFLLDLSNDIGQLLTGGDNYDVIIQAGEGQSMKEFFAHSCILRARSSYFKIAEWKKSENGIIIFKKPNISPGTFELILKFLYTGIINLDNLTGTQVLKLLIATNELNLHKLSNYIQPHLINNQVEYLMNEPVEILQTIHQNEVFENLRKLCLEVICESPRILFESPNIKSLEKELIILLLKQDELGMKESDIWDFILKWGRSKVSNPLDNDVSNWTSNDFEELEKIICDLIPHVRWIQISSETFLREVDPYETIFPRKLYKSIISYHLDPNAQSKTLLLPPRRDISFNSTIICRNHLFIIAGWIDNKNNKFFYNYKNMPYSFNLLYRASRDGFEAKTFHKLCDDEGPTIIISKLQENDKLIGGYNPLSWELYNIENCQDTLTDNKYLLPPSFNNNQFGWGSTSNSFLFTFAKNDPNSGYIARVTKDIEIQKYAVYYKSDFGPAFGNLSIIDKSIHRNDDHDVYPNMNRILSDTKNIVDYEVYQVEYNEASQVERKL